MFKLIDGFDPERANEVRTSLEATLKPLSRHRSH